MGIRVNGGKDNTPDNFPGNAEKRSREGNVSDIIVVTVIIIIIINLTYFKILTVFNDFPKVEY